MSVYEASPDDTEAIRSVARASWETDYPDILSRETVEEGFDEWYSPERLRDAITDPRALVLVAESAETIAGFVHAIVDGEEGDVLRLYVHPDYRGQGIGRDLFASVRENLSEYDVERIKAMVLAENEPGNEFYRNLGFEKVTTGETRIAGEHFEENTYQLQTSRVGGQGQDLET